MHKPTFQVLKKKKNMFAYIVSVLFVYQALTQSIQKTIACKELNAPKRQVMWKVWVLEGLGIIIHRTSELRPSRPSVGVFHLTRLEGQERLAWRVTSIPHCSKTSRMSKTLWERIGYLETTCSPKLLIKIAATSAGRRKTYRTNNKPLYGPIVTWS